MKARTIRIIIYLLLIVLTIKFSLNTIVGATLEKVFADGTKCEVHLTNPKFSFLRLKLSIENVVIRHPEEAADAGFRVDRVSIRLDGWKLLHRELRLNDLKIEGARAISLRKDTGFINLLTFLFPPKKKQEVEVKPPSTLSQIVDYLHFHITTIEILNSKKTTNQLVIGDTLTHFKFDNLHFLFTEQDFDYRKPYDVVASGEKFSVLNAKDKGNNYGRLDISGVMGGGKIVMKDALLGYDNSKTKVSGDIVLGSDGYYQLVVDGKLSQDYFLKVFGEDSFAKPELLNIQGKVSGKLDTPYFLSDVTATFPENGISYLKNGNTPREIKTQLSYTEGKIVVDNLAISSQPNAKRISIQMNDDQTYFITASEIDSDKKEMPNFRITALLDGLREVFTLEEFSLKEYDLTDFSLFLGLFVNKEQVELLKNLAERNSKVNLNVRARCPFNGACDINSNVAINTFNVAKIPVSNLKFSLNKAEEKKEFVFELENIEFLEGRAKGKINTVEDSQKLTGEIGIENLNIKKIPYLENLPESIKAYIQGKIKVLGTFSEPLIDSELTLVSRNTENSNLNLQSLLKVKADLKKLELEGDFFANKLRTKISYPFEDKGKNQFTVVMEATQFPLDLFLAGSSEQQGQSAFTGSLNYVANKEDLSRGVGSIVISNLGVLKNEMLITSHGDLNVEISQGQLKFKNVHLKVGDKELDIVGLIDKDKGWQAAVNGNWELATLIKDTSFFEQLNGAIIFNLNIKGDLSKPIFFGPLKAEGVTISFPLGNNIVGLNEGLIEAELLGERLEINKILTKYSGSQITGSGFVDNVFETDRLMKIFFEIPKIYFEPIDNLNFEAAGKLELTKSLNNPYLLSGLINIDNALYEDVLSLRTLIVSVTDFVSGKRTRTIKRKNIKTDSGENDLNLNIDFRAENGLVLETNIAQAELSCDLNLSGNLENPTLDGKVNAIEGSFGLQSKQFDILNGQVVFLKNARDKEPEISLVGETSIVNRFGEEQRINLLIKGPISNPKADFRSDNGLRKEEIQSLLGLGAGFETLNQNSSYLKKRSVKDLINPTTKIPVEDRFFDLTGFSSLQFGYNFSEQTGEVTPIVTASKILTNYLQLELQSELGSRESSFAGLDYLLNSNFNLTTGWRTTSAIKQENTNVGSFDFGINYRNTYFGYNLFPTKTSEDWQTIDLK